MLSDGLTPYLDFDRRAPASFHRQIYEGLRAAIVSGRLAPGERLPSTRTLAVELGISRMPIVVAFEELLEEGYLVGKVGSGSYVQERLPEALARPITWRTRQERTRLRIDLPHDGSCTQVPSDEATGTFAVGLPAVDRFPRNVLARLIRRHALSSTPELLAYGPAAGYLPLRAAIADHLQHDRAVECDADQVIIVSGSQMGLYLSALALEVADSRGTIYMEEPGYRGAMEAFARAHLVHIPVDADGITVADLAADDTRGGVAYVTPSHQYPLGMSMSLGRRQELLDWAVGSDGWILEDDYDSEFRYSARPYASLQGMDTHDRVIYLGTFSKVLFPSLRLAYIVVPRGLIDPFLRARRSLDIFPSTFAQLVLTDFLEEGHFARHVRRMRTLYRRRRDALLTALSEEADVLTAVANPDTGLHVVVSMPHGVKDVDVVQRARARGVFPSPLSSCCANRPARNGLILGFGGADEAALTEGVRVLAEVVRTLR